jgi:hypothetical protein
MILERIPEIMKLTKAEQDELFGELDDLLARNEAPRVLVNLRAGNPLAS